MFPFLLQLRCTKSVIEIEQSVLSEELAYSYFSWSKRKGWGAKLGKEGNIFVTYSVHQNFCSFKEIRCYCNFGGYCPKGG